MGRNTDPVAAATAAMEAAAAAEAAARAAAEAAKTTSETTTRTTSVDGASLAGATDSLGLPTSIGQQAVADTGAGLPGGGALDDGVFADVSNRDLSSLGSTGPAAHDSLTSLPGLDGSMLGTRIPGGADALAGAMDRFGLDGGGTTSGATMGKGMIMDGGNPPLIPLVGEGSYDSQGNREGGGGTTTGGTTTGGSTTGGSTTDGYVNIGGWGPGGIGDEGGGSTGGTRGSGGDSGADSGTDWGKVWSDVKQGVADGLSQDNLEKAWHDSAVGSVVDWVVDAVSGEDDDDSTSTSTGSGSAATGGAGYQTEDQAGTTRPRGWVDGDDLLTQLGRAGTAGIVSGSRGGDPDGGDSFGGRLGPQGGDTTVNPGSEGTYAQHIGDRGIASRGSAVDLVGQPDRDPDSNVALDPAKLQTIQPGPGPEVINPGDGQAADAEMQASTADGAGASSPAELNGFDSVAGDAAMGSGPTDDLMGPSPEQSHGWEHSQGHAGGQGNSHGHGGSQPLDGLESATDDADVPEEV